MTIKQVRKQSRLIDETCSRSLMASK